LQKGGCVNKDSDRDTARPGGKPMRQSDSWAAEGEDQASLTEEGVLPTSGERDENRKGRSTHQTHRPVERNPNTKKKYLKVWIKGPETGGRWSSYLRMGETLPTQDKKTHEKVRGLGVGAGEKLSTPLPRQPTRGRRT